MSWKDINWSVQFPRRSVYQWLLASLNLYLDIKHLYIKL